MDRKKLEQLIFDTCSVEPDYPWMDTPESAVFRHPGNRKWFALVTTVSRSKLGLPGQQPVDIVNLKCDPLLIGSLRMEPGFYPAYHMNKDNWITAALDGSAPDDTIRMLLERHGFHFSKSMGQNFLIDPQIPADIAAASQADETCGVLEIGPGIGPLTSELAQRAGKVVSIELDRALLPILTETMAPYSNAEIVPGDVTRLDLKALIGEKFAGLRPIVCANLPYNITTPVLTALVDIPAIESITVLIQKEAAQRLTSAKGSADGAFPLRLQYEMETECLFDVPPEKFLPAPKVTSTVLRCVRRKEPPVAVRDEAFLFRVIKGAFLLRRKTLSNSLSAALPGWDKAAIADAIAVCGLPASVRGEALTLTEFAALTDALAERK